MRCLSRIAAGLIAALAMTAPALAQQAGFAKFSPLVVFDTPQLAAPRHLDVKFGAPLALLEQTDTAARIVLDGEQVWVHRADLLIPETPRYVIAGKGFGAEKRPLLRFWQSLSVATEFLSAVDVRRDAPNLEEVRTDARLRDLRLPVLARDVVDASGLRPVTLAAVMLPLSVAVTTRFDQMRGAQQRRYDIALVVDASPDAVTFSADTADYIYRQIGQYLRKSGDSFDISVTLFGANFWTGVEPLGVMDEPRIIARVKGPDGPVADHEEPLLSALRVVAKTLNTDADQRLVIALSGADIVEAAYSADLKKQVTLADPNLTFPPGTAVVLAQVSPEPGQGLTRLSQAPIGVETMEHEPFSDTLGTDVMQRVRNILGNDTERPLSRDDLDIVCGVGRDTGFPCVLPYAATTAAALPHPPTRGKNADWYSTIAWVVLDGLILTEPE